MPLSCTTQLPDSSAIHLGIPINHPHSFSWQICRAFPCFLSTERGGGAAPQHTWTCQSFTYRTLNNKKLYMQRFATFLYNSTAVGQLRNIPGNAKHSHRVLSTKNVICSALPHSCTTPQPWDSSATYLGMPIIHIEYSLLKTSFAALCHILVQLYSRGTAPQHTWECQSFT